MYKNEVNIMTVIYLNQSSCIMGIYEVAKTLTAAIKVAVGFV